jgi:hypothetical protein
MTGLVRMDQAGHREVCGPWVGSGTTATRAMPYEASGTDEGPPNCPHLFARAATPWCLPGGRVPSGFN